MKKLLWCALLLVGMLFVGCSSSEDEGGAAYEQLIGTWDCYLETYTYDDGEVEEYRYERGEVYVVFTPTEFVVYDDEDLMNGRYTEYAVRGNKLYVAGVEWCAIERLTARDLVLLFDFDFDSEWGGSAVQRSYFRKR